MKKYLLLSAVAVVAVVAILAPFFPRGTDLYVHVLWPWQVMRCLAEGSLPVWLPDLNAEFGSPGIGMYSPLSPTLCGLLGLVFGTSGRGVRAVLVLAALAVFVVAPGPRRGARSLAAGFVLLSPAVLAEFFGRFPVAQLVALPLSWLLLETAIERRWRWDRDGILVALLWLTHALTAVMVGLISVLAFFMGLRARGQITAEDGGSGYRVKEVVQFGLVALVAAGLSGWHWWPLFASSSDFTLKSALTEGLFHPTRNLIGVSSPHLLEINTAMGWAAVGLLVALLSSGGWKTRRGAMAIVAIVLASVISAPLWRHLAPLAWLQFPWRWMFPATLLATTAVFDELPRCGRLRSVLSLAALIVPLVGMPPVQLVEDPALAVHTEPVVAGERVSSSFWGNPLLIDVIEHRPVWWEDLGPTLVLLGPRRAVLMPEAGHLSIQEWKPLLRRVVVDSPRPAIVVLRLLADRHWDVFVNQHPAETGRWAAAVAVEVPSGESEIEVVWRTDPRAIAGALLATLVLVGMALNRRREGRFSRLSRRP
jgi:hypothetical protein